MAKRRRAREADDARFTWVAGARVVLENIRSDFGGGKKNGRTKTLRFCRRHFELAVVGSRAC